MNTPTARDALALLLEQPPINLADLVGGGGLYSLTDEHGVVRYIGETGMPFLRRIHGYHCAGDENSHKFSTIFNAGRLWQMSSADINPVKRALNDISDGKVAKGLRATFARANCKARTIHLPELSTRDRKALEDAVLAITPTENKCWNDSRNLHAYEPGGLDDFIMALSLPAGSVEALDRQRERWNSLSPANRAVIRKTRLSRRG